LFSVHREAPLTVSPCSDRNIGVFREFWESIVRLGVP
jgi:hypothetical protein